MITSRISSKAQTTIPLAVRAALGVGQGDDLAYLIEDGRVILIKATPRERHVEADDPFRTFSEWDSEADRKAYAGL